MPPPHTRKMYDGAPLSGLGLGPLLDTAVNTAQRIWNERDPIVPTDQEDEEDQYGPDGTPRAAIQGRRPRRRSTSSQQPPGPVAQVAFPPRAVTTRTDLGSSCTALSPAAEYISSDEGDFEAQSLVDEDEGWFYIDARQQIDKKSGLGVPIMKEDPRYETDRRRKLSENLEKGSRFSKVGEKFMGVFGFGRQAILEVEDGMKSLNIKEQGTRQGEARRRSEGAEGRAEASGAAAKLTRSEERRKPARGVQTTAAALQTRRTRTPFSIEEEIAEAMVSSRGSMMESVHSADSRHGTSPASRERPLHETRATPRHARVESVDDDELGSRPPRHPDAPYPRRQATVTSSDVPDNTVSWRRAHALGASMEQPALARVSIEETHQARPRTKRPPALDLALQATAPNEQANKEKAKPKPTYQSRQPSSLVVDNPRYGQPVSNRPPGLQNIPYRERSRSLDSANWSSDDSDSASEPRNFVQKVNQIALKDDAGWRIPPIGSKRKKNEQRIADQMKRNLQPKVEDVKDEDSVDDTPTFKDNISIDAVSQNTAERGAEQCRVNPPQNQVVNSESATIFSEKEIVEARKGKKKFEGKEESDDDDEFFDAYL